MRTTLPARLGVRADARRAQATVDVMLVAAALVPDTALLVPGVAGVSDVLPDLRAAARTDPYLYYRWNLHWTAAGHRVVAATLARALTSK
jgi:hypothetical protein